MKSDSRQSANLPVEGLLFSVAHFGETLQIQSLLQMKQRFHLKLLCPQRSNLAWVKIKPVYISLTSGSYFGEAEFKPQVLLIVFTIAQQPAEHKAELAVYSHTAVRVCELAFSSHR